jgi:hypothetical protein
MPVNRGTGVDKLLETCRDYFKKTKRRISFEYAMIDGVNDTVYHARFWPTSERHREPCESHPPEQRGGEPPEAL